MIWSERLLLVALLLLFVGKGFIPAWRHLSTDFPNYYLAARLYRQGYPIERVYEYTWMQRQKDHRGIDQGLVGFVPLTLPSMLPVMPLSSLPPLQAKHIWLLMNLLFLLGTAFLLKAITALKLERIALLTLLTVVPLGHSFLYGQMHILVLLLLTLAAWAYFKGSGFFSGMVLALAAALKIYPALFLIFFLFKKQWRAAAGLVVGLAGAAVMSLYLFGWEACRLYGLQVLPQAVRGEVTDPYNVAWNTFTALLRRLFIAEPELNPVPVVHLPWLYALLQPLVHSFILVVFLWAIGSKKGDGDRARIEWAAYLFLLLFLSSQVGSYHLVVLILTAALVADYLTRRQEWLLGGLAMLLYAFICGPILNIPWVSPTGWYNLLFFSRLGFMTLFAGVLLWVLLPPSSELRERLNFRSLLVPTSALIVLVVVGFVSTRKHLDGQFENYKSRIASTADGILASDPAVTSNGVLFTGMIRGGYTVRQLQSGSILELARLNGDWFHPAAPNQSDSIWAEQASPGGSRVFRVPTDALGQKTASVTVEAEDAEEPAVSPDGQLLAFLRAVNGRNSLWIRTIGARAAAPEETESHEIADPDYDVRDASFATGHRLIFSSRRTGRFALYIAAPSGDVQQLTRPSCSARYPAVSPDGRWLAFSCEQGEGWQLYAMDLQGNDLQGDQPLRLSTGDCNSISPVWTTDSKRLIYATDCGRALGLTALVEITVVQ